MNPAALGSGDTKRSQPASPRKEQKDEEKKEERKKRETRDNNPVEPKKEKMIENISPQTIEDHETNLKDRISQCKNIIESLKLELNEEKVKLEKSVANQQQTFTATTVDASPTFTSDYYNVSTSNDILGDIMSLNTDMYSACVDSKLSCDENLIEYEKQLEKYQNTLNRAQIEKKNAIRKQMLTKAYKLKLLELENQCNIELLRVKQSLQCLEPLQMIANKWKTESNEVLYDLDKFELMPCYPEIGGGTSSKVDIEVVKDDGAQPVDKAVENVVSKLSE